MNTGAMYTYYQNGTLMKKKPHPENANYQVVEFIEEFSVFYD